MRGDGAGRVWQGAFADSASFAYPIATTWCQANYAQRAERKRRTDVSVQTATMPTTMRC